MDVTTLRIWWPTKDRIEQDVLPSTGMPLVRQLDVFTHAWELVEADARREAIAASALEGADATSTRVWMITYERLLTIRGRTGMDRVRIFEAMLHVWETLTEQQKDEAIRLSMLATENQAHHAAGDSR